VCIEVRGWGGGGIRETVRRVFFWWVFLHFNSHVCFRCYPSKRAHSRTRRPCPRLCAMSGHFNDPDMLQVGNVGLTLTEQKSHFSLWCIAGAPLLAATDIEHASDETLQILTAPELVEINQVRHAHTHTHARAHTHTRARALCVADVWVCTGATGGWVGGCHCVCVCWGEGVQWLANCTSVCELSSIDMLMYPPIPRDALYGGVISFHLISLHGARTSDWGVPFRASTSVPPLPRRAAMHLVPSPSRARGRPLSSGTLLAQRRARWWVPPLALLRLMSTCIFVNVLPVDCLRFPRARVPLCQRDLGPKWG
jgi:hypothetical protein